MRLRFNIPPFTRALLVLLLGFSCVYQAASFKARTSSAGQVSGNVVPWIALTPQLSVYYPWVYITSTLAEQNILTLAIAGVTFFYGGKYLERAWGSRDFGKFLLLVTVVPNVIAAFIYVLLFAITRSDAQAYLSIQGSISIQAAFLVAFKQLVPEHTVTILRGLIKVRVKHFTSIFLTANTLSGLFLSTPTAALLSWLGFLTSWTYLRFYKPQPDLSGTSTSTSTTPSTIVLRGDASETFAFAYFWPDVVHPPVAAAADAIFNALVALKLCTPFSEDEVESSNQQASARGEGLPGPATACRGAGGGKREEAERRRALALKALDQRLQAAGAGNRSSAPPTPLPVMTPVIPKREEEEGVRNGGEESKVTEEGSSKV